MPEDHRQLLALDGGGVRGLSSLMILRRLMATVNQETPPKPCDYFDMIGGTSTGGLIAVMLGRLRMTVDECIDAYTSLSDRVFEKKGHRVNLRENSRAGSTLRNWSEPSSRSWSNADWMRMHCSMTLMGVAKCEKSYLQSFVP